MANDEDPDFLFHARELSDLEDALSPSSLALMSACLPAAPILVLGLVCLEGKDLVRVKKGAGVVGKLAATCCQQLWVLGLNIMWCCC